MGDVGYLILMGVCFYLGRISAKDSATAAPAVSRELVKATADFLVEGTNISHSALRQILETETFLIQQLKTVEARQTNVVEIISGLLKWQADQIGNVKSHQ